MAVRNGPVVPQWCAVQHNLTLADMNDDDWEPFANISVQRNALPEPTSSGAVRERARALVADKHVGKPCATQQRLSAWPSPWTGVPGHPVATRIASCSQNLSSQHPRDDSRDAARPGRLSSHDGGCFVQPRRQHMMPTTDESATWQPPPQCTSHGPVCMPAGQTTLPPRFIDGGFVPPAVFHQQLTGAGGALDASVACEVEEEPSAVRVHRRYAQDSPTIHTGLEAPLEVTYRLTRQLHELARCSYSEQYERLEEALAAKERREEARLALQTTACDAKVGGLGVAAGARAAPFELRPLEASYGFSLMQVVERVPSR